MDSHQRYVIPDRYSLTLWLFLSFSVLTFTGETSSPNALARVSKSRTGDFHRWSALMEQNLS
jgi:hypothetical protein